MELSLSSSISLVEHLSITGPADLHQISTKHIVYIVVFVPQSAAKNLLYNM